MSVGMKMSLFTLVTLLALAAMPGQSQAQLYEGSNGWFAGGPVGYTAFRPVAVPTTAFYGGGCSTCATPVAVTAFRPGLFGWFRRPVTVVGFAPSCCGTSIAAPACSSCAAPSLANFAPACSTCAAPSLASFTPAPSCCGGSTVTAAYAPTTTSFSAPAASSCCGGGGATTAYYTPPAIAPAAAPYYQPAPTSVASPTPAAASNTVTPTPAAPEPAANPSPTSVYATPQSLTPAASSTGVNSSSTAEPKTFKKEETTAPQFNAPLKPVPQGKTNIKGGLFQGPTLVDPEDRTTQRPTGQFAVKQAVLLQPAKSSTIRPNDAAAIDQEPLDTDGWRPARAR